MGSLGPLEDVVVLMVPHSRFSADVEDLEKRFQIAHSDCQGEHYALWNTDHQVSGSGALHMRRVAVMHFVAKSLDPTEKRFEKLEKADRCSVELQTPSEIGTDQLDLV